MHPHQLHALSVAWSLTQARQYLTVQVTNEAADIATAALIASDGLQAWRPMIGRSRGGHGDPSSHAALATACPAAPA